MTFLTKNSDFGDPHTTVHFSPRFVVKKLSLALRVLPFTDTILPDPWYASS